MKIELSYDLAIPPLEIYLEKIMVQKYPCATVFIASVFIIAKTWKKPKGLSTDKWIKKMCIYIQWNKKESYKAVCSNMERPGNYHTEWSKTERGRQISYENRSYME